jgi:MerR family copper efflux transcriptional regulator
MGTFTIGQLADRTGFSASALRYYEGIGLVVPVARTDAGYRLYDADAVERLAFIARAKQLGCTLEEIADLVAIWDGDRCGPVQRRFHELVTVKLAETQRRLGELADLARQLRTAAARLGTEPTDGACGPACACLAPTVEAPDADVVPISCTLPPSGVAERTREWGAVLAHVTDRSTAADGALRLAFGPATPLDELVRLVAAEQACCTFFAFTLQLDAAGTRLEVRAPADAEPLVTALFAA